LKKDGLDVVDLAKDPFTAGPLARSTTPESKLDKALGNFGPVNLRNRNDV
jgi:hypothetical protein